MQLTNTRQSYGWVAIALHWISAIGVIVLHQLGEAMEEAPDRAAKLIAWGNHVQVGLLLVTFLAARLIWTASQPAPESLETRPPLRILGRAVQGLFMLMILLLIVSGPLTAFTGGRPVPFVGGVELPSLGRIEWLHEGGEVIHKAAATLFWPLIVLHVGGALKHLIIDRDRTLQRMLWPAKSEG